MENTVLLIKTKAGVLENQEEIHDMKRVIAIGTLSPWLSFIL